MSLSITTENMETESWYGSNMSPIDRCGSPESMYCTGNCPFEEGGEPRPDVVSVFSKTLCKKQFFFCSFRFFFILKISLSSSKDSQRSWEDPQGSSMTQALIKVLKNDPNPSLKDLLTLIRLVFGFSYRFLSF